MIRKKEDFIKAIETIREERNKLEQQSEREPAPPPQQYLGVTLNLQAYEEVCIYTKAAELYPPEEHAARLLTIFGSPEKVLAYLNRAFKKFPESYQPLHDACLFDLPTNAIPTEQVLVWQKLTEKFSQDARYLLDVLPLIHHIEVHLKHDLSQQKKRIQLKAQEKELFTKLAREQQHLKDIEQQIKDATKTLGKLISKRIVFRVTDFESLRNGIEEEITSCMEMLEELTIAKKEVCCQKKQIQTELSTVHQQLHQLSITNNTSLNVLLEHAKKLLRYQRYEENPRAADLFLKHKISEKKFNTYLDTIRKPPELKGKPLPAITIAGEDIGYPGFYFVKLDRNDPRIAVLGHLTGCCLSINRVGSHYSQLAWTDNRFGCYVICKGDAKNPSPKDPIYAQALSWRAQNPLLPYTEEAIDAVVFDSVESFYYQQQETIVTSDGMVNVSHEEIYRAFFQAAAEKLIHQEKVQFVGVGFGGQTPPSIRGNAGITHTLQASPLLTDSSVIGILAIGNTDSPSLRKAMHYKQMYLGMFDCEMLSVNEDQIHLNCLLSGAFLTRQKLLCDALIQRGADRNTLKHDVFDRAVRDLLNQIFKNDPNAFDQHLFELAMIIPGAEIPCLSMFMELENEPPIEAVKYFIQKEGALFLFEEMGGFYGHGRSTCLEYMVRNGWKNALQFIFDTYPELCPYLNLYNGGYSLIELAGIFQRSDIQELFHAHGVTTPCFYRQEGHHIIFLFDQSEKRAAQFCLEKGVVSREVDDALFAKVQEKRNECAGKRGWRERQDRLFQVGVEARNVKVVFDVIIEYSTDESVHKKDSLSQQFMLQVIIEALVSSEAAFKDPIFFQSILEKLLNTFPWLTDQGILLHLNRGVIKNPEILSEPMDRIDRRTRDLEILLTLEAYLKTDRLFNAIDYFQYYSNIPVLYQKLVDRLNRFPSAVNWQMAIVKCFIDPETFGDFLTHHLDNLLTMSFSLLDFENSEKKSLKAPAVARFIEKVLECCPPDKKIAIVRVFQNFLDPLNPRESRRFSSVYHKPSKFFDGVTYDRLTQLLKETCVAANDSAKVELNR